MEVKKYLRTVYGITVIFSEKLTALVKIELSFLYIFSKKQFLFNLILI